MLSKQNKAEGRSRHSESTFLVNRSMIDGHIRKMIHNGHKCTSNGTATSIADSGCIQCNRIRLRLDQHTTCFHFELSNAALQLRTIINSIGLDFDSGHQRVIMRSPYRKRMSIERSLIYHWTTIWVYGRLTRRKKWLQRIHVHQMSFAVEWRVGIDLGRWKVDIYRTSHFVYHAFFKKVTIGIERNWSVAKRSGQSRKWADTVNCIQMTDLQWCAVRIHGIWHSSKTFWAQCAVVILNVDHTHAMLHEHPAWTAKHMPYPIFIIEVLSCISAKWPSMG